MRRRLAGGADDLLMTLMADQQDVVVLRGEPACLVVHFGHQRAGSVDGPQAAVFGLLAHFRRDAMCGEHHDRALGNGLGLFDEDRAALFQRPDDMSVMHDLLADVDRRAKSLQRDLHGLDGPVNARAVATGLGEQHSAGLG